MADIADIADEVNEQHLADSLAQLRKSAIILRPKGVCHYCEEDLDPNSKNKLFCDVGCRDDYDRFIARK